ncbi:MAG TPA: protein kinase [Burkholderiales bacterium]|nr:protein kinase [Burkholderiales bacterium]
MSSVPDLKTLGRYNIERVLGKGAMGVVYEGVDPRLGRRVAIKTILKAHLDEDTGKDFAMRFVREAQAVARLNHPNIVQVYDFGEENQIAYLVMEFIKGKELKTFFDANERFDLKEVVRIMFELCEALDFAHNAGIIHRDIKPANVMIDTQGRTKLTDFGVARVQDSDKTSVERTQAGTMVGTPAYMSPEQITGGTIDKRTDVFSAGIILYQFLTGEKPFTGSGAWTIAKKIIQEEPPLPSSLNNAVTPLFDAVVNKALAKDANVRFQSAKELGLALQRALDGRSAEEDDSERTVVGPMADAPAARPAPKMAGAAAEGTGANKTTTGTQSNQEVELEFWRAIKDGNDPDDFELYVQQFPTGIYAALAKRKIAKLRGEPLDASSVNAREQEKKEQEEAARREAEAKVKLEADKARLEAEMARKEEEYKKREAEAQARAEKLRQEAAAELEKREAEFKKRQAEQEAKLGMDAKTRAEAEEKARKEAVEKARQEAAEHAKKEAERAKAEFAAEREKARLEAENTKKEAAAAAEQAKKEAAAERERARLEAEKAKKDAALAAEQAKKEAAAFTEKAKKEADALAKKQTEERAKREAEFKKREAELKAQAAAGGKKSSPVVPAIIGVVVLAIAGTGYWFLRPDDKAAQQQIQAMQRQLEEAKKKQQELEQAKKQEEQARVALEKARAAEAEARKSGDLAKQKELAEAMKRAESEAKKSAEFSRLREDDAKKSAAAAEKAKADQAKVAETKKGEKASSDRSEQAKALAAEKAAADKAIAEAKAQAEKAIAEARAAAEKAATEKLAAEKAAADARAQAASARTTVASAPTSGDSLFSQAASLEQEGKGRDAVKMYTQAARSGNGKAAKRLGEIYDKGLIGISRDYAESLKWYNAARVLGEDVPMAKSR